MKVDSNQDLTSSSRKQLDQSGFSVDAKINRYQSQGALENRGVDFERLDSSNQSSLPNIVDSSRNSVNHEKEPSKAFNSGAIDNYLSTERKIPTTTKGKKLVKRK